MRYGILKSAVMVSVLVSRMCFAAEADTKLSIVGSFGYGMALGGYFIGASEKWEGTTILDQSIAEATDKYLNYGRGFKIDLGAQLGLMENLDMLIVFDYTPGLREVKVEGRVLDTLNYTFTYKKHLMGLKALLLPKFKAFDLFDVCVGGGIGFYWTSLGITSDKNSKRGYFKAKPALSFNGKIGMVYPISDNFGLTFDLTYDAMSFTIKRIKYPNQDNETIFTEDSPNALNSPFKITGSNVGINVGVIVAIL